MNNLHVFVPHIRPDLLAVVPDRPWLTKVRLDDLKNIPEWMSDNQLAESRLFLSDLDHPPIAEWVGVLNARCPWKYVNFDWDKAEERIETVLKTPKDVAICWPTMNGWSDDWLTYSEQIHPGMEQLLKEFHTATSLVPLPRDRPSLWGNDFVCHRSVWVRWRKYYIDATLWFHQRYGLEPPFPAEGIAAKYTTRKIAVLLERITTLFFASNDYNFHNLTRGVWN